MIHLQSLHEALPDTPTVLTIGAFDGVHRGHQALIGELVESAHARGMRAAVLTFFPHPSVVLRGRQPSFYIHRPQEKAALLAELGVDLTLTLPFDHATSEITANDFVSLLRQHLDMRELWAGADFALGHKRTGTIDWLRKHGPEFGFGICVQSPMQVDGVTVSSSLVRRALRAGEVKQAAEYLGRNFRLPGRVMRRSRPDGMSDIQVVVVDIWEERAYPASGVYACRAYAGAAARTAVAAISSPIEMDSEILPPSIKTYLEAVDGQFEQERISLEFVARLASEPALVDGDGYRATIQRDLAKARQLLADMPAGAPA